MSCRFVCLLLTLGAAQAPAAVGVRLLLGVTDTGPVKWDGSVTSRSAKIESVEPWRFDGEDRLLSSNSWQASTHLIRLFGNRGQNHVANGVIVWLADERPDAVLEVKTAQGDFTVRLADIPFGASVRALGGRAVADRIPAPVRLTSGPEEQDYPAAATDRSGNIWLAYTEFRHSPDYERLRQPLQQAPRDFDAWAVPAGGDRILLRERSGESWGEPVAITGGGGDLYRPAVAVDGSGRVWVFWSSNQDGNFDLWARPVANGQPGTPIRLTTEPGSDIDAVAATDAKGNVWVAWQAWRNGRASIQCSWQQGDGFSKAAAVSSSAANEWDPAIAADRSGRVTVAWDSYRNGNYDVYVRTAAAPGRWVKETPVAASALYEAYPSVAYDPSGRLWIAYEEGGERWGKDFGAYDTAGLALYQGRAVRIRGLEPSGRWLEPSAEISTLLPGAPQERVDLPGSQTASPGWETPNPGNAQNRAPNRSASNVSAPRNNLPRLLFDSSGRLWLAFRSAHPIWWNPIGTVWTEYAVSCAAGQCTGPVFLARSDNLLDNRPSLVSTGEGSLLVIGSSDGRQSPRAGHDRSGSERSVGQSHRPFSRLRSAGGQECCCAEPGGPHCRRGRGSGCCRQNAQFPARFASPPARRVPPPQRNLHGWRQ